MRPPNLNFGLIAAVSHPPPRFGMQRLLHPPPRVEAEAKLLLPCLRDETLGACTGLFIVAPVLEAAELHTATTVF